MAGRKRKLEVCVAVLALVGLAAALTPFFHSLQPSAKAHAGVPLYDASDLEIGSYAELQYPDWSIFMIRRTEEAYSVFLLHRGSIADSDYYVVLDPQFHCKDIVIGDGKIKCAGEMDPAPEWSYDGDPTAAAPRWLRSLELLPYSVSGDLVRYGSGA